LIIQADGETWHNNPESIVKDEDINMRLNQYGWTVLRYTEDEIEHHIDTVINHIIETAKQLSGDGGSDADKVKIEAQTFGGYSQLHKLGHSNVLRKYSKENSRLIKKG